MTVYCCKYDHRMMDCFVNFILFCCMYVCSLSVECMSLWEERRERNKGENDHEDDQVKVILC